MQIIVQIRQGTENEINKCDLEKITPKRCRHFADPASRRKPHHQQLLKKHFTAPTRKASLWRSLPAAPQQARVGWKLFQNMVRWKLRPRRLKTMLLCNFSNREFIFLEGQATALSEIFFHSSFFIRKSVMLGCMNVGHIRSESFWRTKLSLTSPCCKGHGERTYTECHFAQVG